jgi:protein CWC15
VSLTLLWFSEEGDREEDDDDEDDDEEELQAELERIKAERAAAQSKKEAEEKELEDKLKVDSAVKGNPLLNLDGGVAKVWCRESFAYSSISFS